MSKILSLEDRQEIINNVNESILILNAFIENKKSYCKCVCKKCGHEFIKPWSNLSRGIGCNKCSKKYRMTLDEARNEFENQGYIPRFTKFNNVSERVELETNDGYKVKTSISSLKRGRKALLFDKTNPYTIYNIKKYLEVNNISCKLISETYKNQKENLLWECNKKHKFKMTLDKMLQGEFCPICNESKLESEISKFLIKNNIEFISQYRFNDCRNKLPLPFDFYINSFNICIEADGIQHFKPTSFSRKNNADSYFKKVIINDNIKNDYCKHNNIKLLRIPYWEFDNIETILKSALF